MKRYFEFIGADSSRSSGQAEKFWEITVSKSELTIRFGKIGANGQTTLKSFPDAATASREAEKSIAEKMKKGYVETGSVAKSATKTGTAKSKPAAKTTECIACAEDIKQNAKLCKHCGTVQDDPKYTSDSDKLNPPSPRFTEFDVRTEAVFACAIDYSSWEVAEEGEEEEAMASASDRFSLSTKTLEKLREWWFDGQNPLLKSLEASLLHFSREKGCNPDELEAIEAQFESDVFCADLIMFLAQHFFGDPPEDDDVHFAETITVNDVDVEDLNSHFANFLKSKAPADVVAEFFEKPAGIKILGSVRS
jgi:predicted DNA-binding WGR domain protein